MRDLIRDLAEDGITVVLSSHLLVEVEDLCNRVAIMRRGRVLYEGSLDGLRDGGGAAEYLLRCSDVGAAAQICGRAPGVTGVERAGTALRFHAGERDVAALSLALGAAGVAITELVCKRVTLEDVFLRLTEDPDGEAPI